MEALAAALGQVLDPSVLGVIAAAAVYGTMFGSIPGLSSKISL
jgi:TctA family transporter